MKSKKVRVGIAGLGRSGWGIHGRLIEEVKQKFEVVAVFDKDTTRRQEAIDRFNCKAYASYNTLVEDKNVELIVVAMPSHLHANYSIQAMKSGKHVVCEKPMATSVKDADRMIAAAKRTKKQLCIFQNYRYHPWNVMVKKIIVSGVLGRIVMIRMALHGFSRRWDWQTLKRFGGGTLNNTVPHPLDLALTLFGDKKPKVTCFRDKALTLGDADDHVKIILSAKGAPTIEVEVTAAGPYPQNSWLICGTQGGLTGNHEQLTWKYINPKKLIKRKVDTEPTAGRSYNNEKYAWTEKSWDAKNDKSRGPAQYYHDLYDTLRKRKKFPITPQSVRRQIWVLDQCRKLAPV